MTTKFECNYCENEYEIIPLTEAADQEQVCYCPYCGMDVDDEEETLEFDDYEE